MDYFVLNLSAPMIYAQRPFEEEEHIFRTIFMRDRDRILYSKSFRRLNGKTQIFVSNFDDHARTRLTHTLEVAQISRTISKMLRLDEDLTEAISFGHDLGHTPFGHMGERTLNYIMNGCEDFSKKILKVQEDMGFKHNLQSVRVALDSQQFLKERGLNLTNYTLFGLFIHSKPTWIKYDENGNEKNCDYKKDTKCLRLLEEFNCDKTRIEVDYYRKYFEFMKQKDNDNLSWSFESLVVAMSDEIAQRHHDLEDGLIAKILTQEEIIEYLKTYFGEYIVGNDKENFIELQSSKGTKYFSSMMSKFIVNFLVNNLINNSIQNLNCFCNSNNITNREEFITKYPDIDFNEIKNIISFEKNLEIAHDLFQKDLGKKILNSFQVQRMDGKAKYIINRLFKAYITNPQQLPDSTIISLYRLYDNHKVEEFIKSYGGENLEEQSIEIRLVGDLRKDLEIKKTVLKFKVCLLRTICDYIAGMTDIYALNEYHQLYG